MYILNEFITLFVQKYVNKTLTKELTKIQVHVTLALVTFSVTFRRNLTKIHQQKSILGGSPRFRHFTQKNNENIFLALSKPDLQIRAYLVIFHIIK